MALLPSLENIRRRRNICLGSVEIFTGIRRVAVVEETLAVVA